MNQSDNSSKFAEVSQMRATEKQTLLKRFNPLTILGASAAVGAVGYGFYSMVTSPEGINSNRAMRIRIIGQAIAVAGLLGVVGYQYYTTPKRQKD